MTTTTVEPIPIIIMSHPSHLWPADGERPAGRHLVMAETGRLLAITRGRVLHAAADRLSQEGYGLSSIIIIRDAHAEAADTAPVSIQDALA